LARTKEGVRLTPGVRDFLDALFAVGTGLTEEKYELMKLSDYVMRYLADYGVRHIFMLTGGGAMHLNDSIGQEKRIQYICNHHEQACAMAAEGYARVSGKVGVICVTSGPGGINALNGVFGAWTDSVPMLALSGQVKRETCMAFQDVPGLRQLGDQEADVISMVKGITKYAVCVGEPETIRYHLEKALHLANSGRPGPCWLDIPIDVQGSEVDETGMVGYDPQEDALNMDREIIGKQCDEIIERIMVSPRPVIMVGAGVRIAGAIEVFNAVKDKLRIPVTVARTAQDTVSSDDPFYCGRPGIDGERAGNFTVQNAETLVVIGSRLSIRQVGYDWKSFARHAFKIQVDVDPVELNKPTVKPDMAVCCDALTFLNEMNCRLEASNYVAEQHADWLAWCKRRVDRYPVVKPEHRSDSGRINPYHFVEALFQLLSSENIVACGNGSAFIIPMQAGFIKKGQRFFFNSGCASMGYDLPAAIGAAIGGKGRRVICLAGDGSIQMNIQELQTIVHHELPIKIIVLNNRGYISIRQTQMNFFGRLMGESPDSGVSFPDLVKVAHAYGIPAFRIDQPASFKSQLEEALNAPGPFLCDVLVDSDQQFEPRLSSRRLPDGRIVSSPLEDMFPFLEREELLDNLVIPPWDS
jgi:acetolactate synthase I/II/III large subunit